MEELKNVEQILKKFCPDMTEEQISSFIYVFFPFMFGVYPYTAVSEKQRTAMKEAEINYVYQSIYDITYACLLGLLGVK